MICGHLEDTDLLQDVFTTGATHLALPYKFGGVVLGAVLVGALADDCKTPSIGERGGKG